MSTQDPALEERAKTKLEMRDIVDVIQHFYSETKDFKEVVQATLDYFEIYEREEIKDYVQLARFVKKTGRNPWCQEVSEGF